MEYGEAKDKYGEVSKDGLTVALLDQAMADNYGTDGEIRYSVTAIDAAGDKYRVMWETTQEWDNHPDEDDHATDETCAWCEDESNACDWDSPAEIYPID